MARVPRHRRPRPAAAGQQGGPEQGDQRHLPAMDLQAIQYNKYNENSLIIHHNTTSRLVTVTPGSVGYLVSSEDMKRCTVQYKVTCNTILNLLKGDTNQVMC